MNGHRCMQSVRVRLKHKDQCLAEDCHWFSMLVHLQCCVFKQHMYDIYGEYAPPPVKCTPTCNGATVAHFNKHRITRAAFKCYRCATSWCVDSIINAHCHNWALQARPCACMINAKLCVRRATTQLQLNQLVKVLTSNSESLLYDIWNSICPQSCMHVSMDVCMYMYVNAYTYTHMRVCLAYTYIYICMCVYVCLYI